jgi:hypothetical protein
MAAMGTTARRTATTPVLSWLLRDGPTLLVVSTVLVVLSLGLRRSVLSAAAAAALMHWGMYEQPDPAVMYVAIAGGLFVWIGLLVTARRTRARSRTRAGGGPASADPSTTR